MSATATQRAYDRASEAIVRHAYDDGLWCDCETSRRQQRRWEQALARLVGEIGR